MSRALATALVVDACIALYEHQHDDPESARAALIADRQLAERVA
jgi:hypothetical protein